MRPCFLNSILCLVLANSALAQGIDQTMCPPSWSENLIYYQSFDSADTPPQVNSITIQVQDTLLSSPGGMHGRRGIPSSATANTNRKLRLSSGSDALSPHKPLTISFWWSLPSDLPVNGGFELVQLHGRGYISHFARGGPWCGMKDSAGVVQIYNLPNINNVNGIYDQSLRQNLGLTKDHWHHTAMVISAASLVSVYTDGKLVFESRTAGRPFSEQDKFNALTIGGGISLDEVMILDTALTADQLADYVAAFQQMHAAYPQN